MPARKAVELTTNDMLIKFAFEKDVPTVHIVVAVVDKDRTVLSKKIPVKEFKDFLGLLESVKPFLAVTRPETKKEL